MAASRRASATRCTRVSICGDGDPLEHDLESYRLPTALDVPADRVRPARASRPGRPVRGQGGRRAADRAGRRGHRERRSRTPWRQAVRPSADHPVRRLPAALQEGSPQWRHASASTSAAPSPTWSSTTTRRGEVARRQGADDARRARGGRGRRGRGARARRAALARAALLPARHDGRPQRAARARTGAEVGLLDDRGLPRRRSRSAAATATSCTTSSGSQPRAARAAPAAAAGRPSAIRADGAVARPLDERRRRATRVERLRRPRASTSVAVAFIHAYANPAHELAAERALRELRLRGRDLALAPRLRRVPRVRADLRRP